MPNKNMLPFPVASSIVGDQTDFGWSRGNEWRKMSKCNKFSIKFLPAFCMHHTMAELRNQKFSDSGRKM